MRISVVDQMGVRVRVSNSHLAVAVDMDGENAGLFTLADVTTGQELLVGTPSLLTLTEEFPLRPTDGSSYRVDETEDVELGRGVRLEVGLADSAGAPASSSITLYENGPWMTYQLRSERQGLIGFRYFDGSGDGRIFTGPHMRVLADEDPVLRSDEVGLGKPLLVWGDQMPGTLVIAVLDRTEISPSYSIKPPSDGPWSPFTLEQFPLRSYMRLTEPTVPARIFISFAPTQDPIEATKGYRETMARLYPPAPMPEWVRFQWLTWYVYFIDVHEAAVRQHIDYIAQYLSDLGPWHVLLDAGWYVTEGRPGANWRTVDVGKFPSGIQDLVDYAHASGVNVVLYFSLPYVDDNPEPGNWMGLRGLLDEGPEWLIPLETGTPVRAAVYDLEHPGFHAFLDELMQDFFLRYGVDGLKVDGLGNSLQPVLAYQLVHERATALRDAVYIEGGWRNPIFAHPYAHTFRYGDEFPVFDSPYPNGGLKQHLDYALYQTFILGQRANMGAIWGDPNREPLNLRWLEAALALGSQVSLSFDFPSMTPQALSQYRARLFHYRPFAGQWRASRDTWPPTSFSYETADTVYIGVFNRDRNPARFRVPLDAHGFQANEPVTLYDVAMRAYRTATGTLEIALGGEEFRLLIGRRTPGPVWTNSSVETEEQGTNHLALRVRGPAVIPGFLELFVPRLREIELDGASLPLSGEPGTARYEAATGVLRLAYSHDTAHRIVVRWD